MFIHKREFIMNLSQPTSTVPEPETMTAPQAHTSPILDCALPSTIDVGEPVITILGPCHVSGGGHKCNAPTVIGNTKSKPNT